MKKKNDREQLRRDCEELAGRFASEDGAYVALDMTGEDNRRAMADLGEAYIVTSMHAFNPSFWHTALICAAEFMELNAGDEREWCRDMRTLLSDIAGSLGERLSLSPREVAVAGIAMGYVVALSLGGYEMNIPLSVVERLNEMAVKVHMPERRPD